MEADGMSSKYATGQSLSHTDEINVFELGRAISHCWDLPMLQKSKMTRLPMISERSLEEDQGLGLAKALRKELISCAEQLSQRPKYSINEIVTTIEKEKYHIGSQELLRIQKLVGVRLPRNKIDLARYYAIRLIMEGVDQQAIAEFLDVDLRTVANYISQAKERIWVILESKSMILQPV
jgi:hypothetical protein